MKLKVFILFLIILFISKNIQATQNLSESLNRVNVNGLFGYINNNGDIIIEPAFNYAQQTFTSDTVAWVRLSSKNFKLINGKGEYIVPKFITPPYPPSCDYILFLNKKWGYLNIKNFTIIKPQFDDAKSFSNNCLAPVKQKDKWGFINENGEWVIEPTYQKVLNFNENGLAEVKQNNQWQIINKKGKIIFPKS